MATCFVVMGFGKKTDFETGRTLDLDKAYRTIIKPAVVDADTESPVGHVSLRSVRVAAGGPALF